MGSSIEKKDLAWRGKASTQGWVFDLMRKAMAGAGRNMRMELLDKQQKSLGILQKVADGQARSSSELYVATAALVKKVESENEALRAELHEARQAAVRNAEEAFAVSQALERRLIRLETEIAKKKK